MIVFDGHTHIYDCYDLDTFVLAAFRNLKAVGAQLPADQTISYFLLMAEATDVYYFRTLREMAAGEKGNTTSWRVDESEESCSLYLFHDDFPSMRVIVVAGRQLITKEKLELLALVSDAEFRDGLELSATVDAVAEAGGVPVCPWGAGKWMGERGKVLEKYLINPHQDFLLGDSGGRPSFWPRPKIFNQDAGVARILSGSDPLPLESDQTRVGTFGGIIKLDCPEDRPADFLRQQLKNPQVQITPYGQLCGPVLFVKNQIALRLN